jgi:hypothetical protein
VDALAMKTLFVLAILAATAHAQSAGDQARAKRQLDLGQRQVADGRYAEALSHFEAGYQASPRPLFLFKIAECARSLGDVVRARESYERYLREDPQGALAAKAQARLVELGIPAPPEPQPSASPPPPDKDPPAPELSVEPETEPPPDGEEEPPPYARPRLRRLQIAAIVTGSVALASGAIGAGMVASVEHDAPLRVPACTQMQCDVSDLFARRYAGVALLGLTGAAAIADIALWIADAKKHSSARRAWVQSTSSGALLGARF